MCQPFLVQHIGTPLYLGKVNYSNFNYSITTPRHILFGKKKKFFHVKFYKIGLDHHLLNFNSDKNSLPRGSHVVSTPHDNRKACSTTSKQAKSCNTTLKNEGNIMEKCKQNNIRRVQTSISILKFIFLFFFLFFAYYKKPIKDFVSFAESLALR